MFYIRITFEDREIEIEFPERSRAANAFDALLRWVEVAWAKVRGRVE